jgi:hypothetical protein
MGRGEENLKHLRLANGGKGAPGTCRNIPLSLLCYIYIDWGTCRAPDECGFDFGDCPNRDICLIDY